MTAVRPEHPCDRHADTDGLPAHRITGASGMAPGPPGKVPAPREDHAGQMTTMIRRSQPGLTSGAILGGSP